MYKLKVSAYANKIGVTNKIAWNYFRAGKLNTYQMHTGTVIVGENIQSALQKCSLYAHYLQKAGFPRFKGYGRYDSFTLKQAGWKLAGRCLALVWVGLFKLFLSRPIEGGIKTVTVRRTPSGKWLVAFSCDNVPNILQAGQACQALTPSVGVA
jgi:hypothetical protein